MYREAINYYTKFIDHDLREKIDRIGGNRSSVIEEIKEFILDNVEPLIVSEINNDLVNLVPIPHKHIIINRLEITVPLYRGGVC